MNHPALILLVDGSPDCRDLYRSILAWAGYEVLEAESGDEGLQVVRERRPDLVITEFPVPVPGYSSLTEALRSDPSLSGIRILTVTAHALPEYRQKAFRAGVDGFLIKPLTPQRLLHVVQHFTPPPEAAA